MTTATQLREKAQNDQNQKMALATFTQCIYWTPADSTPIFMGKLTEPRFGKSLTTVMEIGGMATEVVEFRNHQLPYESEFKAEDFYTALDRAVKTGAIAA